MQDNTLSYEMIVNYFEKETIQDRYKYLYDKMQEYITERKQSESLVVNEDILHQVVMDYFTDIYRIKEFHKIEHINITKIVAYEVFWILRRKPLQIVDGHSDTRLVFANEGFLTTFIAHELLIPEETIPMNDRQEKAFLQYLQHINYHLKYRNVDKQCLETMLYSFSTGREMAQIPI